VGLVLLLLFLGGVAAGSVRLYRLDPAAATGPAAVMAAWAVHAGLDWDWEMPAVTLPALLIAAASVAWSEQLPARDEHEQRAPAPAPEAPEVTAAVLTRYDAGERTS
jgi:hypothetical protein